MRIKNLSYFCYWDVEVLMYLCMFNFFFIYFEFDVVRFNFYGLDYSFLGGMGFFVFYDFLIGLMIVFDMFLIFFELVLMGVISFMMEDVNVLWVFCRFFVEGLNK